jgi:uncharacterized protein YPO0396
MWIRISLIIAVLASLGAIVVSQLTLRNHITGIIAERNDWHSKHDTEKGRADKAERDLKTTTGQLADTKKKLETSEKELASAKTHLADEQRKNTALTTDLATVRAERTDAQQKLSRYENAGLQPEEIKATIEDLKKTRAQNAAIEEEKKILNRTVIKLQAQIDSLIGKDTEVVVQLPPGLKGKVAVVDPKWDFVVLDIGEKQGVLPNGIMMVSRDGKLIGKVKIVTVYPERSIANVMSGAWKVADVQEGDQVLF